MRILLAFILLSLVKIFSHIFYRGVFRFSPSPLTHKDWSDVKMIVILNHTSLYEPLFTQVLPFHFLWKVAAKLSAPGASKTLNRPIVGKFWRLMTPGMSSISRKKDDTWTAFLDTIHPDSLIMIAPEGRMKRPNGLDADGKPMSVKGGIVDILERLHSGKMLLAFSGGLHHVQAPGEMFPRLFKTIKMNIEVHDIGDYKKQFQLQGKEFKLAVTNDLQSRILAQKF